MFTLLHPQSIESTSLKLHHGMEWNGGQGLDWSRISILIRFEYKTLESLHGNPIGNITNMSNQCPHLLQPGSHFSLTCYWMGTSMETGLLKMVCQSWANTKRQVFVRQNNVQKMFFMLIC